MVFNETRDSTGGTGLRGGRGLRDAVFNTLEPLEERTLLSADPLAAARMVDDGDAGFSASGAWVSVSSAGHDGDHLFDAVGLSTATWTFTGLSPGYRYRISATWTAGAGRATDAMYSITEHLDDDTDRLLASVSVDQTAACDDLDESGTLWEDLGDPLLVRGTSLSIELSGEAHGSLSADAIRLERVGTWQAPIGIPTPEFGIEETHWMYADAAYTFDYGDGPEAYRDAGNGPYTHYVDPRDPQATDSGNPFGTPEKPRLSIPSTLAAGSVVELHGQQGYNRRDITATGTPDLPVFIRGVHDSDEPVITVAIRAPADHVVLRHCDVSGNLTGGGAPIVSWDSNITSHAVLYDNVIHDNGDWQSDTENDFHGTTVTANVRNAWIVDNHYYHNAGDAVQVIAGSSFSTDHIYIGRNLMHHDRENAVDIKQCYDVVVSQNTMYGYARSSSRYPASGRRL